MTMRAALCNVLEGVAELRSAITRIDRRRLLTPVAGVTIPPPKKFMQMYASYTVSFQEERRLFSGFERVSTALFHYIPYYSLVLICFVRSRRRGCEAVACRAGYCDGSERKVTQTNLSEKGPT